jgi:hypothetical protein
MPHPPRRLAETVHRRFLRQQLLLACSSLLRGSPKTKQRMHPSLAWALSQTPRLVPPGSRDLLPTAWLGQTGTSHHSRSSPCKWTYPGSGALGKARPPPGLVLLPSQLGRCHTGRGRHSHHVAAPVQQGVYITISYLHQTLQLQLRYAPQVKRWEQQGHTLPAQQHVAHTAHRAPRVPHVHHIYMCPAGCHVPQSGCHGSNRCPCALQAYTHDDAEGTA